MVDHVSFNPFTNNVFTAEEIKRLDLDGDGKVSQNEYNNGISWLSGGVDTDADVDLQSGTNAYEAAKKQGVAETVQTEADFKNAMTIVIDEFKENYFNENKGLTAAERKSAEAMLDSVSSEFITEYISKNPQGPWSVKNAALEFENSVQKSFSEIKEVQNANNSTIANYTDNKEKKKHS